MHNLFEMRLTNEQKSFIIMNYAKFGGFSEFARKYRKEFKTKDTPMRNTVMRLLKKFKDTTSADDLPRSGRPKSVSTEEKIEEVRVLLENNPGMSLRRTAIQTGVSVGRAHFIAKTMLNLYPYKIKILQELKDKDFAKRVNFAKWFLSKDLIADYFIASDEAYFHLDGTVNNHNFRIWSQSNPCFVAEKQLYPAKVSVWCAISKNKIIGPYFFEETVKEGNYLDMVVNYFWPEYCKQNNTTQYYFQQDGAPAHKAKSVQAWLKSKFQDRFIDKDLWPPRSPDLNPCDYFLWGYLKDKVYAKQFDSIEALKEEIVIETKKISRIMLFHVFENLTKRMKLVLENEGKHIE